LEQVTGRRLLVLLIVLVALGIPAGVLHVLCAGGTCRAEGGQARVPFCPLPAALRSAIAAGYREGRSPDVLAVAARTPVYTEGEGLRLPWPATLSTDLRVPIALSGTGVTIGASIPAGTPLDAVAPTVAQILGLERRFPEVRSGRAVGGIADGERPRLVLLIAWKGVGSAELETDPDAWPFLASLLERGAGTVDGTTGSLPLDPAATLTTIGTGGLPSQHGVTGSSIRTDDGQVVPAFAPEAPVTVIASLADDLEDADPRTLVGLVATDQRDRGLVGGGWYPGQDPVDAVFGDAAVAPLGVDVHLATGYGQDDVPDVLGVVLDGNLSRMDGLTRRIVTDAQAATGHRTLVMIAGTGTWARSTLAISDGLAVDAVEDAIPGDAPAVSAVVPGGLFLDQEVLRTRQVTGQVAVDALLEVETPDGGTMMADAFQGFAVSFARYC
jgi:hypothetical protein